MKPHRQFYPGRPIRRLAALTIFALGAAGCADEPLTGPGAATRTDAPTVPPLVTEVAGDLAALDDAVERILPSVRAAVRDALGVPLGRLRAEVSARDRVAAIVSIAALRGVLHHLEYDTADDADLAAISLALDQIETIQSGWFRM